MIRARCFGPGVAVVCLPAGVVILHGRASSPSIDCPIKWWPSLHERPAQTESKRRSPCGATAAQARGKTAGVLPLLAVPGRRGGGNCNCSQIHSRSLQEAVGVLPRYLEVRETTPHKN